MWSCRFLYSTFINPQLQSGTQQPTPDTKTLGVFDMSVPSVILYSSDKVSSKVQYDFHITLNCMKCCEVKTNKITWKIYFQDPEILKSLPDKTLDMD